MTDLIDRAFDTLYERVMEMPNKVLDIFNNFFGEERVDMQGFPSKETLRDYVLRMTVGTLFTKAGMKDKLPIKGASQDEELVDVIDILPEDECITAIVEAFLSHDFVELSKEGKSGFILVHFPRTVVTNEYDRSTVVNHIYIKVPITIYGNENGLFTMNRSEYTAAEIYSNYMHSHASDIPTSDFSRFTSCCLGSGPLKNTQANLSIGFDEDRWNLFCLELSKYVEVESIAGTPYHRLENIRFHNNEVGNLGRLANVASIYIQINRALLRKTLSGFFSYYLEHNNLTFSYRNGVYSLGMPFTEYLIHLSNSFIEYVNSKPELADSGISYADIIESCVIINEKLYKGTTDTEHLIDRYKRYIGEEICTFKGSPVTITITDLEDVSNNSNNNVRLLNIRLASYFLNKLLRTINYRYGRNQENSDSPSDKVRYQI